VSFGWLSFFFGVVSSSLIIVDCRGATVELEASRRQSVPQLTLCSTIEGIGCSGIDSEESVVVKSGEIRGGGWLFEISKIFGGSIKSKNHRVTLHCINR
jgi:hypothetical protein